MANTNTITPHENDSASSDVNPTFARNRLLSCVFQVFQAFLSIITPFWSINTPYPPEENGNTSCRDYDVFINHRGPDVKATFATYLYRRLGECGLKVFLDEPEMQVGDVITGQIKQAIETASIHIAVFSPTYAESSWCLNELEHMWRIHQSRHTTIIPVFYKVDPSEVRLTRRDPTVNYVQALQEKKKRFNFQTIQKWREALKSVAFLSGLELKKCNGLSDEEELVREVVGHVLEQHEKRRLKYVTKDEFGRTVQSCQGKCVGIVGPAGVGKTTLAKQFFNKKRSGYRLSCFISDVKENTTEGSLISMQKQLIKDFTKSDVQIDTIDQGIHLLKKHISSCSVLIILDNVDDASQMDAVLPIRDFLGSNSLILVTSRDKNVFERRITEVSIYNLTGLKTVRPRTSLILAGPWLEHLPPWLGQLMNLKELWLRDSPNLKCLSGQQSLLWPKRSGLYRLLKQLTELTVMDCGIQSLSPDLEKMNNLNVLRVYNCPLGELSFGRKVEDRVICSRDAKLLGAASKWEPPFSQCVCPNLQSLWINSCGYLVKVGSLPTTLTALDFSYCKGLKQIEGLCYLAKLKQLDISGCEEVEELPPLGLLTCLEELKASRCYKLKSIQGLAQLGTKLRLIYVRGCHEIEEMPGLEHLMSLQKLDASGCLKMRWDREVLRQLHQQLKAGLLIDVEVKM